MNGECAFAVGSGMGVGLERPLAPVIASPDAIDPTIGERDYYKSRWFRKVIPRDDPLLAGGGSEAAIRKVAPDARADWWSDASRGGTWTKMITLPAGDNTPL